MHAQQMASTHPSVHGQTNDALIRCIEDCYDCGQTCTACADACLGEEMVRDMVQCIRTCLDCADVCVATGALASRRTGSNPELLGRMLETCADACRTCGAECGKHAGTMEHCEVCADACRRCAEACDEAKRSLGRTVQ